MSEEEESFDVFSQRSRNRNEKPEGEEFQTLEELKKEETDKWSPAQFFRLFGELYFDKYKVRWDGISKGKCRTLMGQLVRKAKEESPEAYKARKSDLKKKMVFAFTHWDKMRSERSMGQESLSLENFYKFVEHIGQYMTHGFTSKGMDRDYNRIHGITGEGSLKELLTGSKDKDTLGEDQKPS